MAGRNFLLLATIASLLLLSGSVEAQKRFDDSQDDSLDQTNAKLAMNRASGSVANEDISRVAVRSKQDTLLDTFRGTTSQVVGDGVWKERGVVTVWYDGEDQIISVEVENKAAEYLEDLFTKMCDEGALY